VKDDRRVGADSVPELLYPEEDVSERGVMREKLDLPRAIKEHVVLYRAHPSVPCSTHEARPRSPTSELLQSLL